MTAPSSAQDFLGYVRLLAEHHRPVPSWYRYNNYYAMLLDLAEPRVARVQSDDALDMFQYNEPNQCYGNCWNTVTEFTGLVYCEGYAQPEDSPFMVNHAWIYDPEQDRIIDPTWGSRGGIATYLGIQFEDVFLFEHGINTGWASMIAGDWRLDGVALRRGFEIVGGRAIDYGPPRPEEDDQASPLVKENA